MPDPFAVQPGPPNSGPEPPGFAAAVSAAFNGTPPAAPPNAYQLLGDDAEAVKLLTDTRKFTDPGREAFEWGWWRSLLYFLGRHWIYWNPNSRTWNDKRLAKWVPKPVTNKVRETYDSIYALLSDITPGVNARPVGREPKNVLTAQTVDDIAPLIHDEHEMTDNMNFADFWAILLGNAYLHPYWDKDDFTRAKMVQMWSCATCHQVFDPEQIVQAGQRCPACQSQGLMPATNPDGSPVMQMVVEGTGKTKVFSPLELLLPLYAQSFKQVDRLIAPVWLPRHEVEDLLADQPEVLKKVNWGMAPQQRSLQLYRSLAMQSDLPMSPAVWNTSAMNNETEGATIQYLWIKACRRYDRGVYLMYVGEGDSAIPVRRANMDGGTEPYIPVTGKNDSPLWPWIHYPYKRVAGRLYAQSAVDVILQKNDQVNQIDSMTQLVANRMGNPIWLEPKGAEVERFTGEPGLIVRYQTIGATQAKPERMAGENPPQSFFALRQQFLQDIEDATGTYDVVKGSKPSGVEAFSALNLLVERSQSRFTPTFKSRGEAYRQWYALAIELERKHGPTERVQNLRGPNNSWTQQIFTNADLQGEVTIVVEDGSNVPKTALGRRAAIEHSNTLGLLAPQQNPDQMYAMMQELGTVNLVPTLDADVKACLQEQQAFEDWANKGMVGPPPLVRMPWHNDAVHYNENRKWMNGDTVREILAKAGPKAAMIVQVLAQHLMEHEQAMLTRQMLQAGAGAPPPTPGGPEAEGAGRAMKNSNQNSGKANQPTPKPGQQAA